MTLLFRTTLTVTTSNSSGEDMRELGYKDLMAIRIPPPCDSVFTIRVKKKSDIRISLSNMVYDSHVSVMQYNL